jgi:hypothetical protein
MAQFLCRFAKRQVNLYLQKLVNITSVERLIRWRRNEKNFIAVSGKKFIISNNQILLSKINFVLQNTLAVPSVLRALCISVRATPVLWRHSAHSKIYFTTLHFRCSGRFHINFYLNGLPLFRGENSDLPFAVCRISECIKTPLFNIFRPWA